MLLEDRFIRRVAAEAGADHEEIEVVPLFSSPDPQIERIGLSLLSEIESGASEANSSPSRWPMCLLYISCGTTLRLETALSEGPGAKAASPNARSGWQQIT